MKKMFLLCNAHLDPVWLWRWDEGAAEAVSTFRVAADFCEQYEGFVFNHNEVILYKWVQEYEPALFERIQRLVAEGKWHIMGGWYLQPDCIMPSGESFSRQILVGRQYFKKYFNKVPTTAINFDSFGHTRGLVQILKKSGYDSYVFGRPNPMPHKDFIWKGYDGSEIIGHRMFGGYMSSRGSAVNKIKKMLEDFPQKETDLQLWGIGNHGGGPSHEDMKMIGEFMRECKTQIVHATPEEYFATVDKQNLETISKSLTPSMVGCYTSAIRIKQRHRELENTLYTTEKMVSAASAASLMEYPKEALDKAQEDLLFSEFHDMLPGSCVKIAEEDTLSILAHGIEELSRIKTRAFFALTGGQKRAEDGTIPIFAYNPHPYKVNATLECEYQLADQNYSNFEYTMGDLYQNGNIIPCQFEKENSNLNMDWRKKIVFNAQLEPSSMNRFDCKLKIESNENLDRNQEFASPLYYGEKNPYLQESENGIRFHNANMLVVISKKTGLVDEYEVDGTPLLKKGAFAPIVMQSNEDPWGMRGSEYKKKIGAFKLLSAKAGSNFSGIHDKVIPSVRIIENGPVRVVVQVVFGYKTSFAVAEYKLCTKGKSIEYSISLLWDQADKMVKLSLPTLIKRGTFVGQTAFGQEKLSGSGMEEVYQKWAMLQSAKGSLAIINNGIYAGSMHGGELRVNLLHSPAYSGHPIGERRIIPGDRAFQRLDMGERSFCMNVIGYCAKADCELDMMAHVYNERPMTLSFFPSGAGIVPQNLIEIDDTSMILSAFKKAEDGNGYILRLFETTGKARTVTISLPALGVKQRLRVKGFEIVTLRAQIGKKRLERCMITEELG